MMGVVRWLMVVGVFLVLPSLASAQEAVLTGTVTDSTNAVVPGVVIRAVHEASGNTFDAVTDQRGGYRLSVRIGTQQLSSNSRGWIHGPGNDGFVKIVEDADRGVLVGATVVSPYGGELLGTLTLAVHAEVPTHTLLTMHYAYPTLHRTVLDAVRALA